MIQKVGRDLLVEVHHELPVHARRARSGRPRRPPAAARPRAARSPVPVAGRALDRRDASRPGGADSGSSGRSEPGARRASRCRRCASRAVSAAVRGSARATGSGPVQGCAATPAQATKKTSSATVIVYRRAGLTALHARPPRRGDSGGRRRARDRHRSPPGDAATDVLGSRRRRRRGGRRRRLRRRRDGRGRGGGDGGRRSRRRGGAARCGATLERHRRSPRPGPMAAGARGRAGPDAPEHVAVPPAAGGATRLARRRATAATAAALASPAAGSASSRSSAMPAAREVGVLGLRGVVVGAEARRRASPVDPRARRCP